MLHAPKRGLLLKLLRQASNHRKLSSIWSGLEERSMSEVRVESLAIAQLLVPVHRDGYASPRSLRTFRKSWLIRSLGELRKAPQGKPVTAAARNVRKLCGLDE